MHSYLTGGPLDPGRCSMYSARVYEMALDGYGPGPILIWIFPLIGIA